MPAPVSTAVGALLRGVFAAILLVRRPRPIHAHGVVLEGMLVPSPRAGSSGIAWFDDAAAPIPVVARLSRSVGLPAPLPDVWGLAVRGDADGHAADLELATTGIGVPGRFALVPRRSPGGAVYTSLLPSRGDSGPVLLAALADRATPLPRRLADLHAALADAPWRLRVCVARPAGRWHPVGEFVLRAAPDQDDRALRFDAVENAPPGIGAYGWVRRIRQPSYRRARRT